MEAKRTAEVHTILTVVRCGTCARTDSFESTRLVLVDSALHDDIGKRWTRFFLDGCIRGVACQLGVFIFNFLLGWAGVSRRGETWIDCLAFVVVLVPVLVVGTVFGLVILNK